MKLVCRTSFWHLMCAISVPLSCVRWKRSGFIKFYFNRSFAVGILQSACATSISKVSFSLTFHPPPFAVPITSRCRPWSWCISTARDGESRSAGFWRLGARPLSRRSSASTSGPLRSPVSSQTGSTGREYRPTGAEIGCTKSALVNGLLVVLLFHRLNSTLNRKYLYPWLLSCTFRCIVIARIG